MSDKAEYYYKNGLRLISTGQFKEAIEFFTKAIEIDPQCPDAYLQRGGILLGMNRIIEGNTDIQKAKDLRSGKIRRGLNGKSGEGKNGKTAKLNWQEVDSIYDTLFQSDYQEIGIDTRELDDDYNIFSDSRAENRKTGGGIVKPFPETRNYPVIIELINGKRLEIARARLFEPTDNDISIIREDGHVERVIPLEHMTCIRKVGKPPKRNKNNNSSCYGEIIETVDGKVHSVSVHPEQEHDTVLFGYSNEDSNEDGTSFICTFIPTVNIRKRCQDRCLGEILLEKGFVGDDMLKDALCEYQENKSIKLGRIIAQKANAVDSAIEEKLEQAVAKNVKKGLKVGEILVAAGLVDEEQVMEALRYQECQQKLKIGQFLVDKGVVREKEVCIALAEKFRIPFVDLRKKKVSRNTLSLLPKKIVMANEILPISLDNGILSVAASHPDVSHLRETIIKECGCRDVRFVLALPTHIRIIIDQLEEKIGCA